jgi:hypothetical protein
MNVHCGPACFACKEADEMTLAYGVKQNVYSGTDEEEQIRKIIASTDNYMRQQVFVEAKYASVKNICKNKQ